MEKELMNMSNSFMLTSHDQLRIAIREMNDLIDESISPRIRFYCFRCITRMFRTFIFLKNGIDNFDEISEVYDSITAIYNSTSIQMNDYSLIMKNMYLEMTKHMDEKRMIHEVRQRAKCLFLSISDDSHEICSDLDFEGSEEESEAELASFSVSFENKFE